MKNFIRGHKLFTSLMLAIAAVIACAIAWDTSASVRGRFQARYDIKRGHYNVLGYGLPSRSRPEYVRLLHERYGIEFHAVAGCIVSQSLISYVDGYNSVSEAAAKRKFGHDVFEESAEEARRISEHGSDPPKEKSVTEEMFPSAPEKTRNIECFRNLSRGISMEELVQHCGRPDEELGSGVYIFVYHLQDGSTVTLGTPYLKRIDKAAYTDASGKHFSLLLQQK